MARFTGFPADKMNSASQRPTKVVWHRQGNPGAEGENGIAWGARTGAFTIHEYIDDQVVLEGIPWDRHAFHVLESRNAQKFGLPSTGVYGPRGDYNTFGVEMEDESPASAELAPGQLYGLSQETRITAVLLGADILRWFPWLTVEDFLEHADLDPWTRSEDIGDGLYMPDFRLDVADSFAGREPWRTVGRFARGTANLSPAPALPEVLVFTQADLNAARLASKEEGRSEVMAAVQREINGLPARWNIQV